MEVYRYTGDIKLLKTIGYRFQKLYASNYKTYIKDHMFMFVIEDMILEYSGLDDEFQKTVIDFILKNKDKDENFWLKSGKFGKVASYCITSFGNLIHRDEYTKNRIHYYEEMKDIMNKEKTGLFLNIEERYKEVNKKEFSSTPYYIDDDLIDKVIELDGLHPLEIITVKEEE